MGGEYGQKTGGGDFHVALAFPDVYEIGMSNLGIRILYDQIHRIPGMACERVFSPWFDMEVELRKRGLTLFSLESHRPVKAFQVLAFSVPHEMTYTNVLQILDLSGIPLRSNRRNKGDPIVIAGGLGICNPSVLSPFIDAFVMGEAEACLERILNTIRDEERHNRSRETILHALAMDRAVYVPLVHGPPSKAETGICKREWLTDWSHREFLPHHDLVPYLPVIQDRIPLEIMRGCSRGCRFCLAGYFYRPRRERDPDLLSDSLKAWIKRTGWEQVGLLSLSSSDYTHLNTLVDSLLPLCHDRGISMHLPSVRADSISEQTLDRLEMLGRFGLTLAPESATARLRASINKDIQDQDLERVISIASSRGHRSVKLYYMIGLPEETEEDRKEIGYQLRQLTSKGGPQIHVNLGLFVPKPHTPFQWVDFPGAFELSERMRVLQNMLKSLRRVRQGHASPLASTLEALLARGDESLGEVLERAYLNGARFDSWTDHFRIDLWKQAMAEQGIDFEAPRPFSFQPGERLPWSMVDTGIKESFLAKEYRKSQSLIRTEDCWFEKCVGCGLTCNSAEKVADSSLCTMPCPPILRSSSSAPSPLFKVRFRFSRDVSLAHLGHVDWTRSMGRLFRRAELPLAYTQGFSKRPRLSMGPPLPMGCSGRGEYVDLLLREVMSLEDMTCRIGSVCPPGVRLTWFSPLDLSARSLDSSCRAMVYAFFVENNDTTRGYLDHFARAPQWKVLREIKDREKRIDLKSLVLWCRHEPGRNRVLVAGAWKDPAAFRPLEFASEVLTRTTKDKTLIPERMDLLGPSLRSISRGVIPHTKQPEASSSVRDDPTNEY